MAAVSVGICAGQAVLDLAYAEDAEADVDCNVVGTASGAFVEIQGTAERRPFSEEQLAELLALAKKGLKKLRELQPEALSRPTSKASTSPDRARLQASAKPRHDLLLAHERPVHRAALRDLDEPLLLLRRQRTGDLDLRVMRVDPARRLSSQSAQSRA